MKYMFKILLFRFLYSVFHRVRYFYLFFFVINLFLLIESLVRFHENIFDIKNQNYALMTVTFVVAWQIFKRKNN